MRLIFFAIVFLFAFVVSANPIENMIPSKPLIKKSIKKGTKKSYVTTKVVNTDEATDDFLEAVGKKYRSMKAIEMKVEKIFSQQLLKKNKKYRGKLYIWKQKFRWDVYSPEKELLLFDGKHIWSVKYPPSGFDDIPIQVLKSSMNNMDKSKVLLSLLMGEGKIQDQFLVHSQEDKNGNFYYELLPRDSGFDFEMLNVVFSKSDQMISEISYDDKVGNHTVWKFDKILERKKPEASLFKFTVPDGAEVSELK